MQETSWTRSVLTWGRKAFGLFLVVASLAGTAHAVDVPDTPEIDPGMIGGALAAAACGLMMISDKIRRK